VLEISASIGNITQWLLPRDLYVASDVSHTIAYLKNFGGQAYLEISASTSTAGRLHQPSRPLRHMVCLSALEHVPIRCPGCATSIPRSAGRPLVLYVPQGGLHSSLDEVLGHTAVTPAILSTELRARSWSSRATGRFGVPGWWWNGRC
jgi:hypothetical protein